MSKFPNWDVASILGKLFDRNDCPTRRKQQLRESSRRSILALEALEDRLAPAIVIDSPTDQGWIPLTASGANQYDYFQDQQTGQTESDLIGDDTTFMFYYQFDDGGDADPTNGTIAFRVRLGQDEPPTGFSRNLFIGVDADGDLALDLYFGVDNNPGGTNSLAIWDPGTDSNTSPSTTSIQTPPIVTYAETAANYDWSPVDNTIDPGVANTDLNGDGAVDHFLSFSFPFNDIITQLANFGVPGVDDHTPLQFIIGTATQSNSLNQDIGGLDGLGDPDTPWTDPITPPVVLENDPPVAQDDFNTTSPDTPVSGNVLTNDSDPEGDPITVTMVNGATFTPGDPIPLPSGGSVVMQTNGDYVYTPPPGFTGDDTFTYEVCDPFDGCDTATVTITVQAAANNPPVARDDFNTTIQDVPVGGNILTNDSDPDGDLLTVTLVEGAPFAPGTPISLPSGGTVTMQPNGDYFYTPPPGFLGNDTFTYEVCDPAGECDTALVTIRVFPIGTPPNQPPIITGPGPQTLIEDGVRYFCGDPSLVIRISDPDAGNAEVEVTLTAPDGTLTLITTFGLTFSEGDGRSDSTMTFRGTIVDINRALYALRFNPDPDFNGMTDITITVNDLGNTGPGGAQTATHVIPITVTPTNDAPVNSLPAAQTTLENTDLVFSAANGNQISVSDVDAGAGVVQVSLSSTYGVMTLAGTTNLTFISGGPTDANRMTFQGTLADINAALNGLSFTPQTGFNGTAMLVVSTNDLGNTGGPARFAGGSVAITVLGQNNAPVISAPGPQSTGVGQDLIFSSSYGNQITIADEDAGMNQIEVTLSVTNGILQLAYTYGLTFISGGNGTNSMTFRGSLPYINLALNGLRYRPTSGFAGMAQLSIGVNDLGSTGMGGPMSDNATVDIMVA